MTKPTFIRITPAGEVTETPLDHVPTLAELQAGVVGDIEIVPHFTRYAGSRCVAFCNEEGKLESFPVNAIATRLWREQFKRRLDDFLVGDIVIVAGPPAFLNRM